SCERPRWSRPRPQTQDVLLPPNPVRAGRAFTPYTTGPHMLVSDSLVDDRGCLTDRTERKPFPCDVNLQRRGPLDSTLNERLGQRVFHILLQRPATLQIYVAGEG